MFKYRVYSFIILTCFGSSAFTAGFQLFETSAAGLGYSYAGSGSSIEDLSLVYSNPALMTINKRHGIQNTIHIIKSKFDFTNNGSKMSKSFGGGNLTGDNDNGGGVSFVPNLYYQTKVNDKHHLGISINAPFGSKSKYDENWVGRYHAIKSSIKTINFNAATAYQLTPKLSIGGGINFQTIEVNLTNAIDLDTLGKTMATVPALAGQATALASGSGDGHASLEVDGHAFGYNLGLVYQANKDTRIGFAYRSAIKHKVKGSADFTLPGDNPTLEGVLATQKNLIDTSINSKAEIPAHAVLSIMSKVSPKVTLYGNIAWTNWNSFEELVIKYDSKQANSITTEDWQDTYKVSLGLGYQYNDKTLLRFGISKDKSAVKNSRLRTPRVPDNDRLWFSTGVGYQYSDDIQIDIGYAYLKVPKTPSNNHLESSISTLEHTLNGEYSSSIHILGLQLVYGF